MQKPLSRAKRWIVSIFVMVWTLWFHYESLRHFYLERWFDTKLPMTKLLFPPAGWIMFYRVGDTSGAAEVWGLKGDTIEKIDPHDIFPNRWVGYDNIHRGVLTHILHPSRGKEFCRYLEWKFPEYDNYGIVQVSYPSVTKQHGKKVLDMIYKCK
jgi:hypothetical protein